MNEIPEQEKSSEQPPEVPETTSSNNSLSSNQFNQDEDPFGPIKREVPSLVTMFVGFVLMASSIILYFSGAGRPPAHWFQKSEAPKTEAGIEDKTNEEKAKAKTGPEEIPKGKSPKVDPFAQDLKDLTIAHLVLAGILFLGWLTTTGLFIGFCVSDAFRMEMALFRSRAGILPSLNELDLIAIIVFWLGLVEWGKIIIFVFGASLTKYEAISVLGIMQMGTYVIAVPVAVYLANYRGKLTFPYRDTGAMGFWPIWKRAPKERGPISSMEGKPTSVLEEAGLGLGFYFLFNWLVALAAGLNFYLVKKAGVEPDMHGIIKLLQTNPPIWVIIVLIVIAVVGAPLFEEIFYRGILYNLVKKRLGVWVGAVFSAAIFSFMHNLQTALIPLFLLGLLFAWLYERTGRLIAPIAMHATFNGVNMIVALSQL